MEEEYLNIYILLSENIFSFIRQANLNECLFGESDFMIKRKCYYKNRTFQKSGK